MLKRSALAIVTLGMLVSTGCQAPQGDGGLRLPGTPNLPAFPSFPTPNLTPGGRTPAVPGVTQTSAHVTDDGVQQVGFFTTLTDRCRDNGADCQSDCQTCAPEFTPVPGFAYDPQEYLCNGGDLPPEARVLQDDSLAGLDPQDAVVQYTSEAGDIYVQESNRVCVYAPRFGSVRQVTSPAAGEKAVGLAGIAKPVGANGMGHTQPSLVLQDSDELGHADVTRRIDLMKDRNRLVPVETLVWPVLAEKPLAILSTLDLRSLEQMNDAQTAVLQQGSLAARFWMIRDAVEVMVEGMKPPVLTRDLSVESFVEYDFPDAGRLKVIKIADRQEAQLGDVVTFAIRIQNVGDSPVSHIEIADSLVTRLEYVEGSQTCDHDAEFDARANEAGSLRLSWKLSETLGVGESAMIEFKCKVR